MSTSKVGADGVVVKTDNLTKIYRDWLGRDKVLALNGLTTEIYKGEVFGLLGPNGSGKTTTVKLLLGLLFPTDGKATVLGRPPRDPQANQRIGFLPEESYLYRFLNATETLDFYAKLFGIPRGERKKRVKQLIEIVGLEHAGNRPLKEYSKGMSRRIGLAQALINDPDFIILDEPTTGLDPIGTREMKDLILELKGRGKTVLLCSHLLADVQDVCDRIAILNKGKLMIVGAVKELLANKDVLSVEVKKPSAELQHKIEALIKQEGGQLASVGHPTSTLEELFMKVIAEDVEHA